jgi:hypothetical protein
MPLRWSLRTPFPCCRALDFARYRSLTWSSSIGGKVAIQLRGLEVWRHMQWLLAGERGCFLGCILGLPGLYARLAWLLIVARLGIVLSV